MTSGRHTPQFHRHFELLLPFIEAPFAFISRKPSVLERVDNIFRPFSIDIWIVVIATMLCFSVVFYVVHYLYSQKLWKQKFHRNEDSSINFILYSFCKITEPDPVPWFTEKWSAGKLLSFQWSLFCLLIVAIYTCNLRAHFAAVDYEKPIDTAEDVIENGKRPWLISELIANS